MRMRGGPPMPARAARQPEHVAAVAPVPTSSSVEMRHSRASRSRTCAPAVVRARLTHA